MRLRSKARLRGIGRYVASGVAIAAMLAQLGGIAHLASVQHFECPDHGELVEVSADSQHELSRDESVAHFHSEGSAARGHDHCFIAALRRQRVRPEAVRAVGGHARQASVARSLPPTVAPAASITVLDLAPKNSPPAV